MHSSRFFWVKPIARLIFKARIFSGNHIISYQSLLLSTMVLNDKTNMRNIYKTEIYANAHNNVYQQKILVDNITKFLHSVTATAFPLDY